MTDTRILISEIKIDPGQEYFVPDYGEIHSDSQSTLICKYFNGRKILHSVYWYSPNNVMGRDTCPILGEK